MKQKLLFTILLFFVAITMNAQTGEIGYETSNSWELPKVFNAGSGNEFTISGVSGSISSGTVCGLSGISHYNLGANAAYLEGRVSENSSALIKTVRLGGCNNQSAESVMGILYSETSDFEATSGEEITIVPSNVSPSGMVYYDLNIPENTKAFRVYRRVTFNGDTFGDNKTVRVAYVSYELESLGDTPSISSLKVNNQNVDVKDEMSYTISYGYSNSTVDIEFQVSPEAEINIDGTNVDNNNGIVSYSISSPELTAGSEAAIAINVSLEDQVKPYLLVVVRGDKKEAGIIGDGSSLVWDFTKWSEATSNELEADTENWAYNTSNKRYGNTVSMSGELIANGKVIEETKGLIFENINSADRIRITPGDNGRLAFNSPDITITVNDLKANQIFSVSVQSSSNTDIRNISLTNNLILIDGEDFVQSSVREFEILEDGSATLKFTGGGVYIYSIEIKGSGSIPLSAEALEGLNAVSLIGDITSEDIAILNAASSLTSINLESASSLAAGLAPSNPNCLVFATSALAIATTDAVTSYNLIIDGEAENITLRDGTDFNNPKAFTANNISYTRNYTTTGWASLCLPFALETIPAGVTVQEFADSEGTNVTFEKVPELEANTPYIAHIPTTGVLEYSATNVNVPESAEMARIIQGEYAFEGTFSRIDDGEGYFLLNSNGKGFGMGASGSDIPAFRAYIDYIGSEPNNAQQLTLGQGGDGTTSLEVVEGNGLAIYSANSGIEVVSDQTLEIVIYSVDGRIVNKVQVTEGTTAIALSKGIYLVNNQKVAVK